MYDHVGLRVADLGASVRFYRAALAPLGFVLCSQDDNCAGLGPEGRPALWLHLVGSRSRDGVHVALSASSRGAVDGFHREGIAAGGKDNGKPGLRADYSPTYYAAFLVDPDGNNVEAVCLTP